MPCNPCKPSTHWEEGEMGDCPGCGGFRWLPKDGGNLYLVPGMKNDSPTIFESNSKHYSIVDELRKPRKIRLPNSIRFYQGSNPVKKKQAKEKSYIEVLFGIKKKPKKPRKEGYLTILRHINSEYADKFGLQLSQLLVGSKVDENEPLLLHWKGQDPFASFPSFQTCTDPLATPISVVDDNWDRYTLALNQMHRFYGNPFRPEQREAIDSVLRQEGSLQIVALPTGFGKTRIVQTVTRVLRNHDAGPTLMISPLVALRDDQREDFEKEVNKPWEHFNDEGLESRFITATEDDHGRIMQELIRDEVDLLCCAPEHILRPSSKTSWFEVFHRMRKPFSTLVVDEAHLIGDWGASIRPDFLLLETLKDRLLEMNPKLRVVLQSATISIEEEKELLSLFSNLQPMNTIRKLDLRDDLYFDVNLVPRDTKHGNKDTINYEKWALLLSEEWKKMPVDWQLPWDDSQDNGRSPFIIYSAKKEGVVEERIASTIRSSTDLVVRTFVGGMSATKKDPTRMSFKNNECNVMVATSAFGMGINKPDVWLIGYLGLPWTLKGLYQGFGRAARGSNWDGKIPLQPSRNGACIAVLPDLKKVGKSIPWTPSIGMELTAERVWDMMMSEKSEALEDRGYLVAPVLENAYTNSWKEPEKTVQFFLDRIVGDLEEEDRDEDIDLTKEDWQILDSGLDARENWTDAERRLNQSRRESYSKNVGFRTWALACLQRNVPQGRAVRLLGFYPYYLMEDRRTGERVSIIDALEQGGHKRVMQVLKSVDSAEGKVTTDPQKRVAVLRFEKPMTSWNAAISAIEKGHDSLKNRHLEGNKELESFMGRVRDGRCIRKSFAPAIGAMLSKTKDCIQLYEDWLKKSRVLRQQGKEHPRQPPVPCSKCIKDPALTDLRDSR